MTVTTDQIRILIVDDQPVAGLDFQALRDSQDNIEIIGRVETGSGAIEEVRRWSPDVVILIGCLTGMSFGWLSRRARPLPAVI